MKPKIKKTVLWKSFKDVAQDAILLSKIVSRELQYMYVRKIKKLQFVSPEIAQNNIKARAITSSLSFPL